MHPEKLDHNFQTSFDLVNLMNGELKITSKKIILKLPTQGKLIKYEDP